MKHGAAYAMLVPAGFLLILLWLLPMGIIAGLSLFESTILTTTWVGLKNYAGMWRDSQWVMAVTNSLFYAGIAIFGTLFFALPLSLSASRLTKRWRYVFRVAVYIPTLAAGMIIGQLWMWVFRPGGVANWALSLVGLGPWRWLGERVLGIPVIGLIAATCAIGGECIMLMAALEGVPKSLREAARMDGAGKLKVWYYIDIPWVMRMLAIILICNVAGGFTIWETVYVLTNGGPEGGTATALFHIWETAFMRRRYGMAGAQSIVMLALVAGLTSLTRRINR